MATVKKILEIEVDVESGDVKVLNSELKKTKKSFKIIKRRVVSFLKNYLQ